MILQTNYRLWTQILFIIISNQELTNWVEKVLTFKIHPSIAVDPLQTQTVLVQPSLNISYIQQYSNMRLGLGLILLQSDHRMTHKWGEKI